MGRVEFEYPQVLDSYSIPVLDSYSTFTRKPTFPKMRVTDKLYAQGSLRLLHSAVKHCDL